MRDIEKQTQEISTRLVELRLIEERYRLLIDYIKMEADKEIYFDREKILKFINILENNKDGNKDE